MPTSCSRRFVFVAAAGMAVLTLGWRLVAFDGFTNDQYVHLALAQQVLLGDRPLRDFIDPGEPLMYLLSAAAWRLGGDPSMPLGAGAVGVEWAVCSAAFAAGAVCLIVAASRLAGSVLLGTLVTALVILITPRDYGYPKVLLYAAAGWAILAVAAAPSRRRIAVLGALVATAFLFRHDHGVYVGTAALAVVVLANGAGGIRPVGRRVLVLAAAIAVVLLPWLVFVGLNGPAEYVRSAFEFARAERVTLLRAWPWFERQSGNNGAVWLFWLYWALPALAALVAVRRRLSHTEHWPGEASALIALSVLAAGANAGFLRDVLTVRVPDASAYAALLGAYALGLAWCRTWRSPLMRAGARLGTILVLMITVGAIAVVANEKLDRAGLAPTPSIRAVRKNVHRGAQLLRSSHRQLPPSRNSQALLPFFEYLDRCTARTDRLLINGLFPDILVLAGRGFAGGAVAMTRGYSPQKGQDDTIARLSRARPVFALLMEDSLEDFRSGFESIAAYIASEYEPLTDWPVDGAGAIHVLVDRQWSAGGRDPQTGFPCFRLPDT